MTERIETAADLDALPVGSVVVDQEGHEFFRQHPDGEPYWGCRCAEAWMTGEHVVEEAGVPLTVVYRPDRDVIAEAEARGAREAWRQALDSANEFVRELTANVPLSAPDPERDPHDEFRRCAVDRMERAKAWRQRLRARAEQTGDGRG